MFDDVEQKDCSQSALILKLYLAGDFYWKGNFMIEFSKHKNNFMLNIFLEFSLSILSLKSFVCLFVF